MIDSVGSTAVRPVQSDPKRTQFVSNDLTFHFAAVVNNHLNAMFISQPLYIRGTHVYAFLSISWDVYAIRFEPRHYVTVSLQSADNQPEEAR